MADMKSEWQRPESGGSFAVWLIRSIALYAGRSLARLILYPITLYFYLRRGHERACLRAYLSRIQGRPGSALQVMHLIHNFAATLLDRVFLLREGADRFDVECEGLDKLDACLARGRGVLLVGCHFGSFEVLRAVSLQRKQKVRLRVVLDKQQTPALTRFLEELAPDIAREVIDISHGGAPAVLAMSETIREGGVVGLLADRARGRERCVRVPFLGDPAPFPVTPWQLAGALRAPVVLCFGIYLGGRRYRVIFEPFSDGLALDRQQRDAQLREVVARYARRLEHYVRTYPDNWFNFHDFWRRAGDTDATETPLDGGMS